MNSPADICVFILAAGRGERMRPLTDQVPKPLLEVAGKPLITHHLERLANSGFRQIVINHAWLGEMIVRELGDGQHLGLDIRYSAEPSGALETLGGIAKALPLINSDPFICLNADVWTDFDAAALLSPLRHKARLVMVDNPPQHSGGDFCIGPDNLLRPCTDKARRLTYSGMALFRRSAFNGIPVERKPLAPILRQWIQKGLVEYIWHRGLWQDIGTPQRLEELNQLFLSTATIKR